MSSISSSACGNNGSVKSTHTRTDVESGSANPPAFSSSAPTTASASADTSSLSAHRVADYTTDPVDPNPSYHNSVEASVAGHIDAVRAVIDNVDAVMDKVGEDKNDGSGE
ncbi:hypothetical protein IFR04_015420 [Cadophora malorum]|uniref:Uncharacterized protein n=1 Tax=Cadophora malorum TaxID=108018 RepID=A0A8H7SZ05_9HELO|nr:hypothetical protein IFR04_015420 [Cadophora malorum]